MKVHKVQTTYATHSFFSTNNNVLISHISKYINYMIYRYFLFFIILLYSSITTNAQNALNKINSKFINYLTATLPEKIYLQTDKSCYVVKDTVWMKAYVINAQIHQPSPSNFVYVELINQLDSIQSRIKIKKDSIGFQGYLKLNKELPTGEYALRAYTSWMRNESPEYFFQKNITIGKVTEAPRVLTIEYKPTEGNEIQAITRYTYNDGSPIKNCRIDFSYNKDGKKYRKRYTLTDKKGEIELGIRLENNAAPTKQILTATVFDSEGGILNSQQFTIPQIKNDFDLQFYPESGILLSETPQTIAFKAIGSDGLSISVTGKIISEGGITLADIKTMHSGMGKFFLCAQKDTTYYALVKTLNGSEKKFRIPSAQAEGIILSLNKRGNNCIYSFENRTPYPTDSLLLLAHTRGMLSITKSLNDKEKVGRFSLNQTPEGILNVAIVNRAGNVFCERMIYIKKNNRPVPTVDTDSLEYKQRSRIKLNINALKGNFSLSVTDAEIVKHNPLENNIISQFLLTSELKGYIENPGYYFTANNNEVNEYLDLLMLTQGWRRYDLSAILQGQIPEIKEPLERGQSLTGRVKPILWRKTDGIEVVGFTNKWKAIRATLDTLGNYVFNGIEFPDSTAFTINAVNKKGKAKGVMIYPDPERYPEAHLFIAHPQPEQKNTRNKVLENYQDLYKKNNSNLQEIILDDVTITAKYISKTGKLAGEFAAHADYLIIDQDIETKYRNKSITNIVNEAIIQRFPGISTANMDTLYYRGKPVRIVVDTKVIELDELQFYMANEVASISFFKDASEVPFFMPVRNGDQMEKMDEYKGVILIELKNGGTAHYYRPSLGLATLYPLGYQKPAEFYSPKYDVPDSLQTTKTDFRTTVYWNPQIQTDSTGHAKVSFYTTDMKHDMDYVLEGITEKGIPCRATGRIKAKKE